jgi:hypothetical protein
MSYEGIALPRPLELPNVSYGPFRLLEAVPWLMFATAVRFVVYGKTAMMLPAMVLESVAIFLALLLAARRMIEFSDGRTDLGKLGFGQQLLLARRVLVNVAVLLLAAAIGTACIGFQDIAPAMILGFDGIAFDQFSKVGMVWSSVLGALVFLMVVKVGTDSPITLRETLREFYSRANWLLPAVVAVVACQFGLSAFQDAARHGVYLFWQTSPSPQMVKNLLYFAFVFSFAAVRLWLTLAILTFALRESYRRNET